MPPLVRALTSIFLAGPRRHSAVDLPCATLQKVWWCVVSVPGTRRPSSNTLNMARVNLCCVLAAFIGAMCLAGSLYGSWWAIKGEREYQAAFDNTTSDCAIKNFGWGYNVIIYEYTVDSVRYMGASHRSFWFAEVGAKCKVAFRTARPEQSRLLGETEDVALSNEDFTSGEPASLAIGRAIICGSLPIVAFISLIATCASACWSCENRITAAQAADERVPVAAPADDATAVDPDPAGPNAV